MNRLSPSPGIFSAEPIFHPRLGDLQGLETDLFTLHGPIHFKSQLKDGVQEITLTPPAKVKLTVIVPKYATGETGPLTAGLLKEDGWRKLPLTPGEQTIVRIPLK